VYDSQPIADDYDLTSFTSGNSELDRWLIEFARTAEAKRVSLRRWARIRTCPSAPSSRCSSRSSSPIPRRLPRDERHGDRVSGWWHRDVIAAGKLPLMLCFVAFVLTFAVTRLITRLIRDQRGPFHNDVTAGGTHIHHAVPGLVLLIVGAFLAVGDSTSLAERSIAGVLVGIGVSLVLDEFALILHLQDVYWTGEGQLSVEVVSLTAGCLGLALVGFSPFGVPEVGGTELTLRISATALLVIDALLVVTCVLKGKYPTALLAIFMPPLAVLGALRLARPTSTWARRRYHDNKLSRAQHRASEFDQRWDPVRTKWEDLIGGTPSQPDPAPATASDSSRPTAG
jgi:hypothetical protein